ncbi:hypothetical protein, partial [Roseospira navarrensis]|uniref:hypothetical protein n=1 Tax=Roseospira navarrensis TaxID=140058 RepID=UPI001B8821CA
PGVHVREVILETTSDPVTWQVHGILPWLEELGGRFLHGGMLSSEAPYKLHGGNFRKGEGL